MLRPCVPEVSVVLTTHNRCALLARVVGALLADAATAELVAVVDGATDGSLELLEGLARDDARLRPVGIENRGKGGAREAGVAAASHPVVLLLDDDVLARPGLVGGHAAYHAERDDLVVVGYMPVPVAVQREGGAPAALYAAWYEDQCRRYESDGASILRGLWGGNVSLRRERALQVGLRNPSFDAGYNQDRDLGLRLLEAGMQGRFDRALRADHLYRRSLDGFLRDAWATGEGTWLVHELHGGVLGRLPQDAHTRHLSPPMVAAVRLARRRRSRPATAAAAALARAADHIGLEPVARRATSAAFCMVQQRASIERSRRAELPAPGDPLPVAVVIPAFNRAELVARAVRSALDQRPNPPAEVIVVDDCSSDDTGAAARAAGARVVRHSVNRGEGAARNTAIRAATQPWVAMLDSDDEWLPGHLAALWPHARGRVILGSTAMACGADPGQDRLWGRDRETPRVLDSPADLLAGGNALVASSVVARRDVILGVGGFREDLKLGADLDLWLRVLERGTGYVSPEVTVLYRLHQGQVSDDRDAMWSAHRAIIGGYRDRPWCTEPVRSGADGILLWDELRDDLRRADRGGALRHLLAIASDRHRAASVVTLLAARFRLRRRSSRHASDSGLLARAAGSRTVRPRAGGLAPEETKV